MLFFSLTRFSHWRSTFFFWSRALFCAFYFLVDRFSSPHNTSLFSSDTISVASDFYVSFHFSQYLCRFMWDTYKKTLYNIKITRSSTNRQFFPAFLSKKRRDCPFKKFVKRKNANNRRKNERATFVGNDLKNFFSYLVVDNL